MTREDREEPSRITWLLIVGELVRAKAAPARMGLAEREHGVLAPRVGLSACRHRDGYRALTGRRYFQASTCNREEDRAVTIGSRCPGRQVGVEARLGSGTG